MMKLKATQSKAFEKMSNNVESDIYEDVILNYKKHGSSHFRDAGIIFFPNEPNSRYEKFCDLMRSKAFRLLQKSDTEYANMDEECLRRATMNPDGKFALKGLEKLNRENALVPDMIKRFENNWENLNLSDNMIEKVTGLEKLTKLSNLQLKRNRIGLDGL